MEKLYLKRNHYGVAYTHSK